MAVKPETNYYFYLALNDYKAQSNCNQDPAFRHSSLVSSLGVI